MINSCLGCLTFLAVLQTQESGLPQGKPGLSPISTVVVGSCARQDRPAPVWEAMAAATPDAVVLLGDNIYGDSANVDVLRAKYQKLIDNPGFVKLRQGRPLLATWDDHDYGENDAGVEYPQKVQSKNLFLEFLGQGAKDPRAGREGIYESWIFGPKGRRVQVILLDTRWGRTPLAKKEGRKGEYVPNDDPKSRILGEDQWAWLEGELKKEAEIRLIGTSIQLVSEDHPFEKWANFPRERARFIDLVDKTEANGVILLSGDRHLGEISTMPARSGGYPLFELTASGINQGAPKFRMVEANRHRVAAMPWGNHFGIVRVDWSKKDPEIRLELRDDLGELVVSSRFSLGVIQRKGPAALRPELLDGEIEPSGVASRIGQDVRLRFRVASAGKAKDGSRVFLNTHDNYRDKSNVTVVLEMKELEKALDEKGIKDPSTDLVGKEVLAIGKVEVFRESPQIVIVSMEKLKTGP